ncbi:MAG: hypothetical protein UV38_C0003G0161 [candidate division TM6 bacterium GW2011_GWE2_42_60]|nr:MAG: hypothetical protein UV38_C0003G0161 [candidate division TM6 bacterium GW2011_GWE2_42_60]
MKHNRANPLTLSVLTLVKMYLEEIVYPEWPGGLYRREWVKR